MNPLRAAAPSCGPPRALATAAGTVELGLLGDHPEALATVTRWLHRQWMRHCGHTLGDARAEVRSRMNHDGLPIAWVAKTGGAVVGTVSISADTQAPGAEPRWCLAGLYVHPRWRRRGVGRLLCTAATAHALQRGLPHLGLYTLDQAAFFARQDWRAQGAIEIVLGGEPHPVTRMALQLTAVARSPAPP